MFASDLHIVNRPFGSGFGLQGINLRRGNFEFADVAGGKSLLSERCNLTTQPGCLASDGLCARCPDKFGMSPPDIANHVQPVLHHRLADAVQIQFRRSDPDRLQPQRIDRLVTERLDDFRADWKIQHELRIADQPGVQELSIGHSQLSQHSLIRGVVPQSR